MMRRTLPSLLALLLAASPVAAQTPPAPEPPEGTAPAPLPAPDKPTRSQASMGGVQVSADRMHYSQTGDTITADGNVVVTRGAARLSATHVEWLRGEGRVVGEGNVRLEEAAHRLAADRFEWNIAEGSGRVLGGELVVDGRYYLDGESITRSANGRIRVRHGVFSACSCEPGERRAWSVAARSLSAIPGGTLVARSLTFRVKDVPVLYVPVFLFPTSDRQTGLLLPTIGGDTRDGVRVVQPFYWAINQWSDLTVAWDHRSRRGPGGQLEYRYMASRYTRGSLSAEGFDDRADGLHRVLGHWRHATVRPEGWNLHADMIRVNRRDYLRQVGESAEVRTTESLESNLFATRSTSGAVTAVLFRHTEDLVGAAAAPTQHLPSLRAGVLDRRLGPLPVWAGLTASADNLVRDPGADVVRADLAPRLSLRLPLLGGRFTAAGRAEARAIVYSERAGGGSATTARTYPLSATLGTRISGRLFGLPHRIEPQIHYRYVPVHPAKSDAFDQLEGIAPAREVVARLNQRVGPLHWRLALPYDLRDQAPVAVRSRVSVPVPGGAVVRADSLHRPQDATVEWLAADLAVRARGITLSVGDVYDRGTLATGTPFWADTVTVQSPGGTRSHMQRGRVVVGQWAGVELSAHVDYDARDHRAAEAGAGLAFVGSCWSLALEYVDFPDRNLVRFRLALAGAGGRERTAAFADPLFGAGARPGAL